MPVEPQLWDFHVQSLFLGLQNRCPIAAALARVVQHNLGGFLLHLSPTSDYLRPIAINLDEEGEKIPNLPIIRGAGVSKIPIYGGKVNMNKDKTVACVALVTEVKWWSECCGVKAKRVRGAKSEIQFNKKKGKKGKEELWTQNPRAGQNPEVTRRVQVGGGSQSQHSGEIQVQAGENTLILASGYRDKDFPAEGPGEV
ncbi:hypothetical protein HGM15179_014970 [Zosterops borbonicus]|uniref:Uncharacterized protein n=1 Tax=Zosterops borbonicus TaxID=364589 RepID=A0A8K1G5R1_9PASS|nr:hypothetical protein HGM15179_014970 [Zosterops borbonicus]